TISTIAKVGRYKGKTQSEMKGRSMNASLRNKAGAKVFVAGRRESEGQAVVHGIENSGGRGLFVKTYVALEAGWASRRQNASNCLISSAKREALRNPNESPYVPEVRTYAQLQRQIHHALRAQHPEWIQPDGDCPVCDAYESRLAKLLGLSRRVSERSVTT